MLTDGRAPEAPLPQANMQAELRPLFHFTPATNFMNDPNGLVFLDGEYTSSTSTTPRAISGDI